MDRSKQNQQRRAEGILCLPMEIIFSIFLQFPAPFLWEVARLVCKRWYNIISNPDFVTAQFTESKDVLLVKEYGLEERMQCLEKAGNGIRRRMIGAPGFRFPGRPGNSCRGLCVFLLMHFNPYNILDRSLPKEISDSRTLCVANPLTRQSERLPCFLGGVIGCFLLAFTERTKVYKAICIWSFGSISSFFTYALGIDENWRKHSYVPEPILRLISNLTSVCIGDSLYVLQSETHIISINLHEEAIEYLHFPHGCIFLSFGLLQKGDLVTCFVLHEDSLAVWAWNKSEWLELCTIYDPSPLVGFSGCNCGSFSPIGWLDDSVLLFSNRMRLSFWSYDVNTGERDVEALSDDCLRYSLLHRDSLAKW